jgi:hypothetical protein
MSPERSRERPTRVLVTGWFSFLHGEATAGDLLAADTVSGWLADRGVPHDVAMSPVLGGDPALEDIYPGDYTHLLFVCGPVAGWQVERLLQRFQGCTRIAVGVSVVEGTPHGFDHVLARDGLGAGLPDLSLAAPVRSLPPVVAVVRAHPQEEYAQGKYDDAHAVIDEALRNADVAVLEADTRVDGREVVGRRTRDVEALLARADAVVSTRMHGLVLALRHGVPAVPVDPIPDGAKVSAQAATLGWPAALGIDDLTIDRVGEALKWALGPEAARLAARAAGSGRERLGHVRDQLLGLLRD